MTVCEMLINFGKARNTIPSIQPLIIGGAHRLRYNDKPLPESNLATRLPALGCKVTNNSKQDIYVYFNNDEDKGDIVGRGGVERVFDGFSISDIYIINRGDEPTNPGEIELMLYTDHAGLDRYYRLLAQQKTKKIPKILPDSLVGGGF